MLPWHGEAVEMTRQETFKRRIRQRMEKTGERYGAARRNLIEKSDTMTQRKWVSEPEMADDTLREATGKGWDEWCEVIDGWPGNQEGHTAIATFLREDHEVDGWWAQTITVGYERITGMRLPYQQPDGTFSAGKSRTVAADPGLLRDLLLNDEDRADLFPGMETELRSRPTAKTLRIGIGPGTAQIAIETVDDGRAKVSIAHDKLPSPESVEDWKAYWTDWLEAIDGA
jgi:hypothetical protein